MRVLHITNQLEQGGVDTLLVQLLPILRERGVEVGLFVLGRTSESLAEELRSKGVEVYVSGRSNLYDPTVVFQIRKLAKRYDVVHAHLFPTQYYVAALKLLCPRKLLVTTEHCTTNKRRHSVLFAWLERFIYKAYRVKIGVSRAAAQNLAAWIGGETTTIVNGIDLERVYRAAACSPISVGVPDGAASVVMVARFFDQKDQQTAVRAMQWLSDEVHLLFVGSGETMSECKALAESLQVQERVHFLGQRSDAVSIVKMATVCLLSTHYEGLSIAMIEYCAAGKAVVGSDVDGVRELVSDPRLLFPIGDDRALAASVRLLLEDADLRMAVEQTNFVRSQDYALASMADKYVEVYHNLMQ